MQLKAFGGRSAEKVEALEGRAYAIRQGRRGRCVLRPTSSGDSSKSRERVVVAAATGRKMSVPQRATDMGTHGCTPAGCAQVGAGDVLMGG